MVRGIVLGVGLLSLVSVACKNPASDKPAAVVSVPAPETAARRPAAASQTFAIAADTSKVEFVGSKVTGSHQGGFKQFSGSVSVAGNKPETSQVTIEIDAASLWSDTEKLTVHLKSKDFFDVLTYPKITFASASIVPGSLPGMTHTISGNLDLHGVKKLISFPATIAIAPDAITATSEFSINRKDFGIIYPGMTDDLIRDLVLIKLSIRAPRK